METTVLFTPIDKESSTDIFKEILTQVIDNIKTGNLKPGDSLPAERAMAETLGISRPVLREVLKSLELLGIINSVQGSGNVISENLENCMITPLSVMFSLMNSSLSDAVVLRSAIETKLSMLAAEKCNNINAAELTLLLEKLRTAETMEERIEIDNQFHRKISEIADNKILYAISLAASDLVSDIIREYHLRRSRSNDTLDKFIEVHAEIVDKIIKQDAVGVYYAMKEHMYLLHNTIHDNE
ncbi:MAG: FCD domain-containing protein [Lachnospiraceae bacterium]|nr:FCD domain-containing protein [Lachnospiraceae bacterium]